MAAEDPWSHGDPWGSGGDGAHRDAGSSSAAGASSLPAAAPSPPDQRPADVPVEFLSQLPAGSMCPDDLLHDLGPTPRPAGAADDCVLASGGGDPGLAPVLEFMRGLKAQQEAAASQADTTAANNAAALDQLTTLVSSSVAAARQEVNDLSRKNDRKAKEQDSAITELDNQVVSVHHEVRAMSLENRDLRARMDTMEKELAVVKQTDKLPAAALAEHEWTRDPDPTILFIGAKTLVSKASIENFVQAEHTNAHAVVLVVILG